MANVKQIMISACLASTLSLASTNAFGFAGFAAGYAAACGLCDGAIEGAFAIVDASITASEQVLLESMGMGASMGTGTVGFPMLQATVESASGKETKQIVQALELATKQIAQEVRTLPIKQQKHILEQTLGESAIAHTEDWKKDIEAGMTFNLGGDSSLGYGWQFLTGQRPILGSDMSANQRASSSVSDQQMTKAAARATIATNVKNTTRTAQSQALRSAKIAAHDKGARLFELLGGNLLISDKYTTIKEGSIEDDNLDLLAQLSISDIPSTADAVQMTATTNAEIDSVVDDKVNRMGMSIPMAIQDRYVRMRRAHGTSIGAEEYMLSAIGEQVNGPISDEGFLRLMGTKRVRDSRWLAITAVDARFATQELAQMEAEHLYIKYQKYLAKRDLNFALSQVVAKFLQKERP